MDLTADDWLNILPRLGVKDAVARAWAPAFESETQPSLFSQGMDDIMAALPHLLHETGMLEQMEENLRYSAKRLMAVWPSRFPTLASAEPFALNPQALANKVYGGRMGNVEPDDGWNYRGRAWGLTGRANYALVGDWMGQDLVGMPHLIEGSYYALNSFRAYWEGAIPDNILSDQTKMRRRYNGGLIGMEHVAQLHRRVLEVFA